MGRFFHNKRDSAKAKTSMSPFPLGKTKPIPPPFLKRLSWEQTNDYDETKTIQL